MTIQATARVIQNRIELQVGEESWIGRPVVQATGALSRRIAALFSTVYEIRTVAEPEAVRSTVSYLPKKDEILIQIGEQKWKTHSTLFGPTTFEYGGLTYSIVEKLTGRFAILRGEEILAEGDLGFRSCSVRGYPPELEGFLASLCLGYLMRSLFWAQ
ncbi:MAG: hypothetical protein ACREC5_01595 [Thermoplasmata archaeon]